MKGLYKGLMIITIISVSEISKLIHNLEIKSHFLTACRLKTRSNAEFRINLGNLGVLRNNLGNCLKLDKDVMILLQILS